MAAVGNRCLVFGIINLTPDSFSGGIGEASYFDCLSIAKEMLRDGATHIDVGGESTRPGAETVDFETEWARLEPFLNLARQEDLMQSVSVDTRKSEVMLRAAAMGVAFINCVGQIPPPDTLRQLKGANPRLSFIGCHMAGDPKTMQENPAPYPKALSDVTAYFNQGSESLLASGFSVDEIYMDPGIGFGKTDHANWGLLLQIPTLSSRFNLAVGISRKGFIGRALDISRPKDRDPASKLMEYALTLAGAKLVRTHDVRGLARARDAIGWGGLP